MNDTEEQKPAIAPSSRPENNADNDSEDNDNPAPIGRRASDSPRIRRRKKLVEAAKNKDDAAQKAQILKDTAAVVPKNYIAQARELRKKRSIGLAKRFVIIVGFPTVLATIYFAFVASDIFQSISVFNIQSSDNRTPAGIESLLGTFGGSSTSRDSMMVQGYILSRDMLKKLDKEHQLIAHYQDRNRDIISRLASDASFEEAYEHYLDAVEVQYDTASGSLTLSVKTYSARTSHDLAASILKYSEEAVNKFSERIRNDQVAFMEKAVQKAEKRLKAAQQALLALQQQESEFSPDRSAATLMSVKSQLESELAKARTELNQIRAVMAPTAPQVLTLSQKVQSLQRQIKQENKRLLGTNENGLGSSIVDFETAMMEKGFAEKEYATAMTSVELARLEALKQSRYLARISTPSFPDEATYPKRILGVLTFFLVMMALFGIGSLLIAATKEHARI